MSHGFDVSAGPLARRRRRGPTGSDPGHTRAANPLAHDRHARCTQAIALRRAGAQAVLATVRRPDGRPDTRSQASLASVLAANGRAAEAERTFRAVLDSGYMDHHVAYALGAFEAQRGRAVDAVKWLRMAADTGFSCYESVMRDALLDPIRSTPDFQAILVTLRADYDRTRTRYQAVFSTSAAREGRD